jgi:hypothetical protein
MNHHRVRNYVLLMGALTLCCQHMARGEVIPIVADATDTPAVQLAMADLEHTLKARSLQPERRQSLDEAAPWSIVVGLANSPEVARLLTAHEIALPESPESLCIRRLSVSTRKLLLLAGRDARGLSYALLEAARAIELAPPSGDPLAGVPDALESPFLRVRSTTIHPCNEDLENSWYYDERFWRDYFARLARCRYNNFTLTFSDQTNYLNPVYAWLVDVPEFPQIEVQGLAPGSRTRNLATLRRIAECARDRGLDFTLGIWMQAPVPEYSAAVRARNLPQGLAAASYSALALRRVLEECPAITGVQFRMNSEAGVPEEQQTQFYQPLFEAIRDCGRPVRLDLRYKGLRPETTKGARDAGLNVTVSTKFWAEHLGLPYHPTVVDRNYRESRYSFGRMLAHPRGYRVIYRLWTVGSQRLLLWGDPEFAARFAQSCRLGGGEGFEVFSPLTNQGHGNDPGAWRILASKSDEYYTWERQRYWFFDLVFGRLGYNPQANPEVWRRELRHRFGEAASDLETAYGQASRILSLITATRLPSASEWRWWPETDTGGRLAEYMRVQPADTAQFYAIRSWQRTPRWAWENWDESIPGYVEDALAGRDRGKTAPREVSRDLLRHAHEVERCLDSARRKLEGETAEFRATQVDLGVLASLGRYHAEKTAAATHLAFFELSGEAARLPEALTHARVAADAWRRIVQLTDGFYSDNLVFGIAPGSSRSRLGQHHGGHWKDRLPEVQADVAWLEQLVAQQPVTGQPLRTFPGETELGSVPMITHQPPTRANPGTPLAIDIRVESAVPLEQVILHYRPLDQAIDWKQTPMKQVDEGAYQTVLAVDETLAKYDLQYYFEVLAKGGGGWLWPAWRKSAPYVVIPTWSQR